ncbi:MAG: hypothetical protein ACXWLR_08630, partial [Myxococcales bacterium]
MGALAVARDGEDLRVLEDGDLVLCRFLGLGVEPQESRDLLHGVLLGVKGFYQADERRRAGSTALPKEEEKGLQRPAASRQRDGALPELGHVVRQRVTDVLQLPARDVVVEDAEHGPG